MFCNYYNEVEMNRLLGDAVTLMNLRALRQGLGVAQKDKFVHVRIPGLHYLRRIARPQAGELSQSRR